MAATGRVLIGGGVLVMLFLGYQLWGTSLAESHGQADLARQYRAAQGHPREAPAGAASTRGAAAEPPAAPGPAPGPALDGSALAVISIPRLHLQKYVVEGTGEHELQEGPGHYTGTPLPGQEGNVAIAGHRTTYGAPFYNLDQLTAGDSVLLRTVDGSMFEYDVTGSRVVAPGDVSVIGPEAGHHLTLTTCTPRYSAAQRLIVFASMREDASGHGLPPTPPGPSVGTAALTSAATSSPDAADVGGSPRDLTSGSTAGVPGLVAWGLTAGLVGLATLSVARRRRSPWRAYLIGAPVLLVPLYFLFENVSSLLPPSV